MRGSPAERRPVRALGTERARRRKEQSYQEDTDHPQNIAAVTVRDNTQLPRGVAGFEDFARVHPASDSMLAAYFIAGGCASSQRYVWREPAPNCSRKIPRK